MNFQNVFIVSGQPGGKTVTTIVDNVVAQGLQASVHAQQEMAGLLQGRGPASVEPALVILDPDISNAVALGRAVHAAWPASHILFVQRPDMVDRFRMSLGLAPMLGPHWSVGVADDSHIGQQIATAVAATRRRTRLRTTLDRANVVLACPKPPETRETHRTISEYYLVNFLSHASESILALDVQAKVLYWNESARALLDIDASRLLGMDLKELPLWSPALATALVEVEKQATVRCELFYPPGTRDTVLDVSCSAVRDPGGGLVGTTLMIRDVTDRHRLLAAERRQHRYIETMLTRERARILELFDLAPGFMALFQGTGHIVELANRAFLGIFEGRTLIGSTLETAFPELREHELLIRLDEVFTSGQPFVATSMHIAYKTANGRDRALFLDLVCQPVRDRTGAVVGVFCQGSDVTERRRAQDALMAHQAELEKMVEERTDSLRRAEQALHQAQKLESLGKLTGGVAHDFNNILQVIAGNLELLRNGIGSGPVDHARIDTAVMAVDRGAKLSSQLLAFARKQPLQPVPTNVARIVGSMDDMLRRALGEGVELETVVGTGLWSAMVDRNQFENVILNLAINARDAMEGRGRLTIEVENTLLDADYVKANVDVVPGHYVMLAVSDIGAGMPSDVIERAFEPFFTTKPEGQGTGLGLSMAYGFVKQSSGHIKIYSEPGHGTTIKVYLPRIDLPEAIVAEMSQRVPVGGSETILVVDDDEAVRTTAVNLLSAMGYRVLQAQGGHEGLMMLRSGIAVDLLFTDVVMPGSVTSTELARHARELHSDLEVLFTSGYTRNAIVHGGRLDPNVDLISKPYRQEELAKKVRSLLDRRPDRPSNRTPQDEPVCPATGPEARTILVVEDNQDAREILCELLVALGYQVLSATTAEEALQRLVERPVDVLLTDIGLPGMDGEELARRALALYDGVRVVFASGYGVVHADDIPSRSLPKPYTIQDLEQVLNDL